MGTELAREASAAIFHQLGLSDEQGNLLPEFAASLKTIHQGAATTIWCATSPLLDNIGGVYCEDADIAGLSSVEEISAGVKPWSLDENNARQLWTLSEKLTGVPFNAARSFLININDRPASELTGRFFTYF